MDRPFMPIVAAIVEMLMIDPPPLAAIFGAMVVVEEEGGLDVDGDRGVEVGLGQLVGWDCQGRCRTGRLLSCYGPRFFAVWWVAEPTRPGRSVPRAELQRSR